MINPTKELSNILKYPHLILLKILILKKQPFFQSANKTQLLKKYVQLEINQHLKIQ